MHNANAAAGTSSLSGSRRVIPPQDKLRKLVKEWDKDGDGLISFPEFTRALKTCALAISNHLEACSSPPVGLLSVGLLSVGLLCVGLLCVGLLCSAPLVCALALSASFWRVHTHQAESLHHQEGRAGALRNGRQR